MSGIDAYAKLVLHLDNNVTDSEITPKTVTNFGATFSDTYKKFGTHSAYLDGSDDYMTVLDSVDWNFGSGNFTVDFWIKWHSYQAYWRGIISHGYIISGDNQYLNWMIVKAKDQDALAFVFNSQYATIHYSAEMSNLGSGDWIHIALVRDSNTLRWFNNGVAKGTNDVTGLTINSTSFDLNIARCVAGAGPGAVNYLGAYLDEIRVSKGVARWTSDFTPPTVAYSFESRQKARSIIIA